MRNAEKHKDHSFSHFSPKALPISSRVEGHDAQMWCPAVQLRREVRERGAHGARQTDHWTAWWRSGSGWIRRILTGFRRNKQRLKNPILQITYIYIIMYYIETIPKMLNDAQVTCPIYGHLTSLGSLGMARNELGCLLPKKCRGAAWDGAVNASKHPCKDFDGLWTMEMEVLGAK